MLNHQFNYQYLCNYFLSECAKDSQCPNNGENYKCVSNFCTCASGYVLDGEACVGMLLN